MAPLFSQLLSCVVGLSSVGSTKLCPVGISFLGNPYSTVWSEREGPFYLKKNALLFTQAFFFLNNPGSNMYICFGGWKLGVLPNCRATLNTGNGESVTLPCTAAGMVRFEL